MSSADVRKTRVAVVAARQLEGQAITAALRTRRFVPVLFPWPRRTEGGRAFNRRLVRHRISVGLILCDLDTPDLLHDVELLVTQDAARWLVLTETPPGPRWGAVLESGALGVLPTSIRITSLVAAIRGAVVGRSPTPPELRERAIKDWREIAEEQRALVRRMERLTHREFEVLGLLYDGISVRRIAEASGVSEATVRTQVKAVRRKLDVDSQLAAVATYRKALEVFPRRRWSHA